MRYSEISDGPLIVKLKTGEEKDLQYEDGGGMFIGDEKYEIHFIDKLDCMCAIYQDEIESVRLYCTGEEVEFGNPYMPGHPRPKRLPKDIIDSVQAE